MTRIEPPRLHKEHAWTWATLRPGTPEALRSRLRAAGWRWSEKRNAFYMIYDHPLATMEAWMHELVQLTLDDLLSKDQGEGDANSQAASAPVLPTRLYPDLSAKLRALAANLDATIQDKLHRGISGNVTRKRAAEAEQRVKDGMHLQRVQRALYALADLHEQNAVPPDLAKIASKSLIDTFLYCEHWPKSTFSKDVRVSLERAGLTAATYEAARTRLLALIEGQRDPAQEQALQLAALLREVLLQPPPGFFPTPEAVQQQILGHIRPRLRPGARALEPSAGRGDLVQMLLDAEPGLQIDCCEWNSRLHEVLTLRGYTVLGDDCLSLPPDPVYDLVVMNPPFEKYADITHVQAMYARLAPGGRLVSVHPRHHPETRSGKKLSAWLESVGGRTEPCADGAFLTGARTTAVQTMLVIIDKEPA